MKVSLRTRQIATVLALVACPLLALAGLHLSTLTAVHLEESAARAELLARAIFQQAAQVVPGAADPRLALQTDPGIRATLETSIAYTRNVTYATIIDTAGRAIVHSSPDLQGRPQPAGRDLTTLLQAGTITRLRAVYDDAMLEVEQPLVLGNTPFGAIRIGLSPALIRDELADALGPAALIVGVTLVTALLISLVLAGWVLRPIHVIRAGLRRLGRGEPDVHLDLPADRAFSDMEASFEAISAQLAAAPAAGSGTREGARQPVSFERLLAGVAHEVKNPLNGMAIHLELLKQKLGATPRAADGRTAPPGSVLGVQRGVAGGAPDGGPGDDPANPLRHVEILDTEVRRLDGVIQGFLRFIRPGELRTEPVVVADLVDEVFALVQPDAHRHDVALELSCPEDGLAVEGDREMLRQTLLNLALNACQAMPAGGTLRVDAGRSGADAVTIEIADTGAGMSTAQMERMFELYYTTREGGSGIGLSLVYRTVQLHGGEIEVESTPDVGTCFRVTLPAANDERTGQAADG